MRAFRSALVTLSLLTSVSVFGQAPVEQAEGPEPGQQVYERSCAVCHNGGDARAHALDMLQMMNANG